MLDWILDALSEAGFSRKDVVFVCGYKEDRVRERYPEFTFVPNLDWANNNILLSLLCAREHLTGGFLSSYADIVYDGAIAKKVAQSSHDIVLGTDTHWRRRYVSRTQHPETDAEKLRADDDRVLEVSRSIAPEAASGEFIGVLKMSGAGADLFLEHFDSARREFASGLFHEGRSFEKAYLIDLLQRMIAQGVVMHRVDTRGAYMELDTLEDLSLAEEWWRTRP
jgi:choline kinase